MRDFAIEAATSTNASESQSRPSPSSDGLPKSFWTKHIRITIEEDESRDHLGTTHNWVSYSAC